MARQRVKIIPTVNYSCLNDVSLVRFTVVHKVFFFDLSKNPLNCRPWVFFCLHIHAQHNSFFSQLFTINRTNSLPMLVNTVDGFGIETVIHLKFNNVELFVILPHEISPVRLCHFHLFFFLFLPLFLSSSSLFLCWFIILFYLTIFIPMSKSFKAQICLIKEIQTIKPIEKKIIARRKSVNANKLKSKSNKN